MLKPYEENYLVTHAVMTYILLVSGISYMRDESSFQQ
jgi:hypothetical protein